MHSNLLHNTYMWLFRCFVVCQFDLNFSVRIIWIDYSSGHGSILMTRKSAFLKSFLNDANILCRAKMIEVLIPTERRLWWDFAHHWWENLMLGVECLLSWREFIFVYIQFLFTCFIKRLKVIQTVRHLWEVHFSYMIEFLHVIDRIIYFLSSFKSVLHLRCYTRCPPQRILHSLNRHQPLWLLIVFAWIKTMEIEAWRVTSIINFNCFA